MAVDSTRYGAFESLVKNGNFRFWVLKTRIMIINYI
jgi:hypothetical protein